MSSSPPSAPPPPPPRARELNLSHLALPSSLDSGGLALLSPETLNSCSIVSSTSTRAPLPANLASSDGSGSLDGPQLSTDSPMRSARHHPQQLPPATLDGTGTSARLPPALLLTSTSTADELQEQGSLGPSTATQSVTNTNDAPSTSSQLNTATSTSSNNNMVAAIGGGGSAPPLLGIVGLVSELSVGASVRTSIRSLDMGALMARGAGNLTTDDGEVIDNDEDDDEMMYAAADGSADEFVAMSPSCSRGSFQPAGGGGGMGDTQTSTSGAVTAMSTSGRPVNGLVGLMSAGGFSLGDDVSDQAGMSSAQLTTGESGEYSCFGDAPPAPGAGRRKQRCTEAEFRGWEQIGSESEEDDDENEDAMFTPDAHKTRRRSSAAAAAAAAATATTTVAVASTTAATACKPSREADDEEAERQRRMAAIMERFAAVPLQAQYLQASDGSKNDSFGARGASSACYDDGQTLIDNASLATQPPEMSMQFTSASATYEAALGSTRPAGMSVAALGDEICALDDAADADGDDDAAVDTMRSTTAAASGHTNKHADDADDSVLHGSVTLLDVKACTAAADPTAAAAAEKQRKQQQDIVVMSYNVLAQRYATSDKYSEYCSAEALELGYRLKNISRIIAGIRPDIVLLQEVASALADDGSLLRVELDKCGVTELEFIPVTTPDGTDRIDTLRAARREQQLARQNNAGGDPQQQHHRHHKDHQRVLDDDQYGNDSPTSPDCDGGLTNDSFGNLDVSAAGGHGGRGRKTCSALAHIEGVAIGWNPQRFGIVERRFVRFNRIAEETMPDLPQAEKVLLQKPSHNVSCIVALRDLCAAQEEEDDEETIVIVATIHCYYDITRRECQLWQLARLTEEIARFKGELLGAAAAAGRRRRVDVILGGDFNCEIDFYPLQFLETGKVVLPDAAAALAQLDGAGGGSSSVMPGASVTSLSAVTTSTSANPSTPQQEHSSGAFSSVTGASSSAAAAASTGAGGGFQSGMGSAQASGAVLTMMMPPRGASASVSAADVSTSSYSHVMFDGCVPPTPSKHGTAPRGRHRRVLSNLAKPVQAPHVLATIQNATCAGLRCTYREYIERYPKHVSCYDVSTNFAGVIDHIFVSDAFRVRKVARILAKPKGIPSATEPSDHVPVAVVLKRAPPR